MIGSANAHTQRDILHSIREWRQESSWPHTEQHDDGAIFRLCLTSPVGSEHWVNLHKKTRTLEGTLHFQSFDHSLLSAGVLDAADLLSK
jgi:hypothetical protein